jgi:2-polyprenyl-3-methyl-5-hydroxy-6-metoxy-1,4-benzoquinol methylase
MAHDHGKHDHHHDHDHNHNHDGHHHDWHSEHYVGHWIENDARRQGERGPIIERLIAAVPFGRDAAIHVIDIGAGAGLVTEAVLGAFPNAKITLQDYSRPMLDRARERLGDRGGQIRYALCDLLDPGWANSVGGPFDLAVSAIAIHNLQDMAAIGACYDAVHGLLKAGGCFLDYDHFDRIGGVPLHQHRLKVAGFSSAEAVWHEHPTAVVKAMV